MDRKYPSFGVVSATPVVEDIFYVQLHGVTWAFPRKKFITLFPDSMLVAALETSSDSVIPLENPVITAEILSYLWFITQYGFTLPPFGMQTRPAGSYLGIPILWVASNPCLRHIPQVGNLLDMTIMKEEERFWPVVSAAARAEDIEVLQYIFDLIPAEMTLDMDGMLMIDAAINGWSEVFRVLMRRGLKPRQIVENGRHSLPYIGLMVPDERVFDHWDKIDVVERSARHFLQKQKQAKEDQIPYLVLLAPIMMQPGHMAILKMLLETVGLPDELILSMTREYISRANVCVDVVKMLLSHLQHLESTQLVGLYPTIVERHLVEVYSYIHHDLKVPAGMDHIAAIGDIAEVQHFLTYNQSDAGLTQMIKSAVEEGHYDVVAILIPKLSHTEQISLLEAALAYPGCIEFFLKIRPVGEKMLTGWIEDILQRGLYGINTLVVLSKQPGMQEFLLKAIQDPNYNIEPSWRHDVAKALGIVLPA